MPTGDKYTNIAQKRLMGRDSWKDYFLDYLKDKLVTPLHARVYNKDGTFGDAKLQIKAGGSNDQIKLEMVSEWPTFLYGTDGSGHLFKVVGASPPSYFADVPFENQTGNDYDVGLQYSERPSGVQTNARTGKPEYQQWQEEMGVADDPVSVADQGGGIFRFRLPTSMCPGDRTCAGRKCIVWMKVPADGALTEAIAILELTVAHSTYNYVDVDTGTYDLGQTTFSTDETKYTVMLLGPTIARTGDLDIEAADDYWYIGEVTGNGPAATPTVFDMSDQRLIKKSLSDLLENLVYDNVVNTFTRKQIFAPTVEVPEEAINATGYGANPGVKGTGGTNGNGQEGYGTGTGSGLYGKGGDTGGAGVVGEGGQGPGTGVLGKPGIANGTSGVAVHGDGTANGGGYGGYFRGKVVDPVKAAAAIVPQSNDPSALADGDHWQTTEDKQAKARVNGSTRIYAEQQLSRTFLYPIACGQPESLANAAEWYWDVEEHSWRGNNNSTPEEITFDLNRFIPQGATIKRLRAWMDPVTVPARDDKANRPFMFLYSFDAIGETGDEHFRSCLADNTGNPQWLDLIGGSHDGGDGQAILTDSFQSWAVDDLVGRTVFNLTDGSSGTITANTLNTVTATLSGGTDNDWDDGDVYSIAIDVVLNSATRQYFCAIFGGNDVQIDYIYSLEVTYTENEYLRVP